MSEKLATLEKKGGSGGVSIPDCIAVCYSHGSTNNSVSLFENGTGKCSTGGTNITNTYFSATASTSSVTLKARLAGKYRIYTGNSPFSTSGLSETEVTATANQTLVSYTSIPTRYNVVIPLF